MHDKEKVKQDIEELEKKLEELKRKKPAHLIPVSMMQDLEDLED